MNLGYGSITDGWDPGPADVPAPFGLFPTDLNWGDVLTALANGVPQGIQAAIKDLLDPDNYQIPPLLDNPAVAPLVNAAYTMGLTDNPDASLLELLKGALSGFANFPITGASLSSSSPTELIDTFTATLSADYATLLPIADAANALLTSVPAYDASVFVDQLEAGNLVGAIGDPLIADEVLLPFAPTLAVVSLLEAAGGTLVNLVDLFS